MNAGSVNKVWQISKRLLYQNRWIYLLLMLWPLGMAAILLVPSDKPELEDVLSILHQECLYGFGMVAFTGAALLGNEQRSRRIAGVLARAVSRREYFVALVAAAWLPLLLYGISFVLSGIPLLNAVGKSSQHPLNLLLGLVCLQWSLGLLSATAALFFATLLPTMLASTATLASLAVLGYLGSLLPGLAPAHLLFLLTQGDLREAARAAAHPGGVLSILVVAFIFFAAGVSVFEHRDLPLKSD